MANTHDPEDDAESGNLESEDSIHRAERLSLLSEKGICWKDWPDEPWSLHYYFSTRGQDNFHIYFWLLKDLSWLQCWYYLGHISGLLALAWSLLMMSRTLLKGKWTHTWLLLAQFIWLFSNYWWMDGELHDYKFPNEKSIYDQRTRQASYLSLTAFSMIAGYYCVVFPYLKLTRGKARRVTPLGNQPHRRKMSYDPTLRLEHPIPAVFDSWADYEDLHLLFWLGKDFAWIWELQILWIAFIGPTFFIGVDFVWKSLMTRRMMIDHAHYVAQFLWVLSNATWACGELFLSLRYDDPTELIGWNDSYSRRSARWYASWILVGAFVPLVALYAIWLGGTVRGRIVSPPELLEWKGKSTLSEPLMSR